MNCTNVLSNKLKEWQSVANWHLAVQQEDCECQCSMADLKFNAQYTAECLCHYQCSYKSSRAGGLLTRPLHVIVAPWAWLAGGPGDWALIGLGGLGGVTRAKLGAYGACGGKLCHGSLGLVDSPVAAGGDGDDSRCVGLRVSGAAANVGRRRCFLLRLYFFPWHCMTYDLGTVWWLTTVAGNHSFTPGNSAIRTGSPGWSSERSTPACLSK